MKKIAVRGGHNFSVQGASKLISETKEDRLVKDAVIKHLKAEGIQVLDVTSPDSCNTISSDLAYGVNKANNWGAELFVSVHFNKAYDSYNGAIGTEVWTYNSKFTEATEVVNNLSKLGFTNRGVKHSTKLYELRETSCKSMIVEVCFVEATKDVEIYKRVGHDSIGKAIAEGILRKKISGAPSQVKPPAQPSERPLWERCVSGQIVKDLQTELNKQLGAGIKVDGYFGEDTLKKCPVVKQGANGNITKVIQKRLLAKGHTSLNKHGGADGSFGAGTTAAVKDFQKKNGLDADGIVGRNTWIKLFLK